MWQIIINIQFNCQFSDAIDTQFAINQWTIYLFIFTLRALFIILGNGYWTTNSDLNVDSFERETKRFHRTNWMTIGWWTTDRPTNRPKASNKWALARTNICVCVCARFNFKPNQHLEFMTCENKIERERTIPKKRAKVWMIIMTCVDYILEATETQKSQ